MSRMREIWGAEFQQVRKKWLRPDDIPSFRIQPGRLWRFLNTLDKLSEGLNHSVPGQIADTLNLGLPAGGLIGGRTSGG